MKIAIVNNFVPFIYGGAEFLADSLRNKLIEYGYKATVIKIPLKWYPPQKILEHMLACRLMRFENIDRLIALKFPVYYVKHPNKVLWLLHQFRQAYELWGTPYQDIPDTPEGLKIREAVIHADNTFLQEVKKIYTNSKTVSNRLKKFNDIDSEVLYPPLMNAGEYYCEEYSDYIFYPSRITRCKRQYLAVEAMRYIKSNIKLLIAGNPDSEEELKYVESTVRKNNLESKVKIMGRWISQAEKIKLFANALGCIYIPYDEDSYGYVSLEAYHSRKPVITCTDSGGTLEVVEDGVSGFVVPPEPEAIAETVDKLFYSKALAAKMGQRGYEKLLSMKITWDNVIHRLTK
ncbi:MAG: glycosyltransferase family 4 protein [Nitrospirota bacterium]